MDSSQLKMPKDLHVKIIQLPSDYCMTKVENTTKEVKSSILKTRGKKQHSVDVSTKVDKGACKEINSDDVTAEIMECMSENVEHNDRKLCSTDYFQSNDVINCFSNRPVEIILAQKSHADGQDSTSNETRIAQNESYNTAAIDIPYEENDIEIPLDVALETIISQSKENSDSEDYKPVQVNYINVNPMTLKMLLEHDERLKRERERLIKRKQRENEIYRNKEREINRLKMQKRRQDERYASAERARERERKRRVRMQARLQQMEIKSAVKEES